MSLPSSGHGHTAEMGFEQITRYAVIALIAAVLLHGVAAVIDGGILAWWGAGPLGSPRLVGAGAIYVIAALAEIGAASLLLQPVVGGAGPPRKEEILSGTGKYLKLYYLVLGYFFLAGLAFTVAGAYVAGISLILASVFFGVVFAAWRGMFPMPPVMLAVFALVGGVLFSIYGFAPPIGISLYVFPYVFPGFLTSYASLGIEAGLLGLCIIFAGIYHLLTNMGVRNPGLEKVVYYIIIATGEVGFIVGGVQGLISIANRFAWWGAYIALSVFLLFYSLAALIGGLIALLYTAKQAITEISAMTSPPPAPPTPPPPPPSGS